MPAPSDGARPPRPGICPDGVPARRGERIRDSRFLVEQGGVPRPGPQPRRVRGDRPRLRGAHGERDAHRRLRHGDIAPGYPSAQIRSPIAGKGKPCRTFAVTSASNRSNMRVTTAAVALLAGGCFFGYRDAGGPNAPRVHRGTFVRGMILTGELNAAEGSTIAVP